MTVQIEHSAAKQVVTIANGQTESSVFNMRGFAGGEIRLPAAFTGVALTFKTSEDDAGTFKTKKDGAGAAVSLTCAAGDALTLPAELYGSWYVKIVSGSSEAAAREITVLLVT